MSRSSVHRESSAFYRFASQRQAAQIRSVVAKPVINLGANDHATRRLIPRHQWDAWLCNSTEAVAIGLDSATQAVALHSCFGVYDRTFDSWTYYHNSIDLQLFFIRLNCVSETPSHSLLTVKETAEYLRIPLPTVYYLVQRGQIPAIQIGGRWRIKKSSLDRDILREDKQGQPTVLAVDDDLGIQELFKTFLKRIGFSRVVVGTAKEAISSLRKQKFDLMFLDLQLPDEPGDQVYKTAKQIDPGLNVIVITGYPDSQVLDRILQISPVTVLKKPLRIEQLNQTAKMLGHKAALVEA